MKKILFVILLTLCLSCYVNGQIDTITQYVYVEEYLKGREDSIINKFYYKEDIINVQEVVECIGDKQTEWLDYRNIDPYKKNLKQC
jgi:hypothetical protein